MILIGGLFGRLNTGCTLPAYRFRLWIIRVSFLVYSRSQFVREALSGLRLAVFSLCEFAVPFAL
ncbi:hypothetical protein D9G64_21280 [Escherichia coli]|nr:hypothetical protein [Escherichia coli]